jgi:AcrR family transcriptional regulator
VADPRYARPAPPVGASERERVVAATVDLVLEQGYEATSVESILARAGVGRVEFERHFASKQDCCIQIYAGYIEEFNDAVFARIDASEPWRERLRAAAYASARFFRDNPREVRYSVTGILAAGEMAQVMREQHLELMVDLIDSARAELPDPDSVSRAVAESVVGSIFGFLLKAVHKEGDARSAESFVPDLMYIAVRPYLGHPEALEELSIPPPPEPNDHG